MKERQYAYNVIHGNTNIWTEDKTRVYWNICGRFTAECRV